jgi:hypothetical protein
VAAVLVGTNCILFLYRCTRAEVVTVCGACGQARCVQHAETGFCECFGDLEVYNFGAAGGIKLKKNRGVDDLEAADGVNI